MRRLSGAVMLGACGPRRTFERPIMARNTLTGSRIRERRIVKAIKQADLARRVGISPAYLNLIEHNRRRIGGKLLVDLARELETDVVALAEGAEAPLVEGLKSAASEELVGGDEPIELDHVEEFAGRFPGWAGLALRQRDRIAILERRVEALNDRLAHDPYLADALHDLLSSVTAIRSTAGILNTSGDIDPEWQVRFHRNLYEDSQRLAEGSQALVNYLETIGNPDETLSTPLDELDAWLRRRDYSPDVAQDAAQSQAGKQDTQEATHAPSQAQAEASQRGAALAAPAVQDSGQSRDLISDTAQQLAARWTRDAQADLSLMPLDLVDDVIAHDGVDPAALARRAGCSFEAAMRRLASLPADKGRPPIGMARCDGSGALTFRKPIDGFALPRFGTGCPRWPLYQSMLRPMVPIRQIFALEGQSSRRFLAFAICVTSGGVAFEGPEIVEASMIIVGVDHAGPAGAPLDDRAAALIPDIGLACRVCAHTGCEDTELPAPDAGARGLLA